MDCAAPVVLTPPTTPIAITLYSREGDLTNDASNHINSIYQPFRDILSGNSLLQLYATPPRPNRTSLNRVRAALLNGPYPGQIACKTQCAPHYNYRFNNAYAPDGWFIRFEAYIINYNTGAQGNRVTNILAIE